MLWTSLIILVSVLGVLIGVGVVANVLQGPNRVWKLMSERYPPAAGDPDADSKRYQIYLGAPGNESVFQRRPPGCLWIFMPWTITRGIQEAFITVDDDHLHLQRTGGPGVNAMPISIPWSVVEFGSAFKTHLGEYATLLVDEAQLNVPVPAVERELAVRAEMQKGRVDPAQAARLDKELIEKMRTQGLDMSRRYLVDFFFWLPTRDAADALAERLGDDYSITIEHRDDVDGMQWSVEAVRPLILDETIFPRFRAQMESLADEFGGEYDGHGVSVDPID